MSRKIKVLFSMFTVLFSLTAFSKKILIQDPVRPQQEPVRVVILEKDFGKVDEKYNLEIHHRIGLIEQLADEKVLVTIPAQEPHLTKNELKRLQKAVAELDAKGKVKKLDD
jgi:hypothetical protein